MRLVAGHTKGKPGYWLPTDGSGILTYEDSDKGVYRNKSDKVYDDWDGVEELVNLPDHSFHREVNKRVLDAATWKAWRCAQGCIGLSCNHLR